MGGREARSVALEALDLGTEDEAPGFEATRPQDRSFVGNIVEAMQAYATGSLGSQAVSFADCDRVIAIGSDRMMAAVGAARHTLLAPYLKPGHRALAALEDQVREFCARCLDPKIARELEQVVADHVRLGVACRADPARPDHDVDAIHGSACGIGAVKDEAFEGHIRRRLLVRPGITGWTQVNGRNALSWEQKFALDGLTRRLQIIGVPLESVLA